MDPYRASKRSIVVVLVLYVLQDITLGLVNVVPIYLASFSVTWKKLGIYSIRGKLVRVWVWIHMSVPLVWKHTNTSNPYPYPICSCAGMKELDSEMVSKLCTCIRQIDLFEWTLVPSDHLINIYLEAGNDAWLPLAV